MTPAELHNLFTAYPAISTDTRKVLPDSLFFALRGPTFNGNDFAKAALESGAAYAIVDDPAARTSDKTILVPDALRALQELAGFHRSRLNIPFIAITGSNGKTTTKELVSRVLSARFRTYTTEGNLNNHIGIPLTLLKIRDDAEMAVVEMGANHQREIAGYCTYANPTHGIITNCGKAHLEGFGGVEGVRKGKGELYDHLRAHAGTAFAFSNYDYLHEMAHGIPEVVWYGTSQGLVTGTVHRAPFLEVDLKAGFEARLRTQLVGDYNLPNVLCAVTVGKYFRVPDEDIVRSIESYTPDNSRSQMLERDSNHFILDAYNANPSSMRAAVENFAAMEGGPKVLLLGGMAELGEESLAEHQALVRLIASHPWQDVVLVGGDFGRIDTAPFHYFPSAAEARAWLLDRNFQNTWFLLKGSRSMKMESLLA